MFKEKIILKKSKINNLGMFASENIKKGETICLMKGVEKTIPELKREIFEGRERINDPFQITNRTYLDLKKPYLLFNHSCDPNAGIKGKNELFAIRNIKKGEEITYDYSTTSWEEDWKLDDDEEFSMRCNCGAKNCRKIITDFCYLDKKTKEKYLKIGALPDFILKKLNEQHS